MDSANVSSSNYSVPKVTAVRLHGKDPWELLGRMREDVHSSVLTPCQTSMESVRFGERVSHQGVSGPCSDKIWSSVQNYTFLCSKTIAIQRTA